MRRAAGNRARGMACCMAVTDGLRVEGRPTRQWKRLPASHQVHGRTARYESVRKAARGSGGCRAGDVAAGVQFQLRGLTVLLIRYSRSSGPRRRTRVSALSVLRMGGRAGGARA